LQNKVFLFLRRNMIMNNVTFAEINLSKQAQETN